MNKEKLYDVVVVGGGPAGLTAAIYLARAKYRVVVVEKEHFGGQITITSEVVNYPGVMRTSGTALTDTMRRQAEGFGAEFLLTGVESLELSGEIKKVRTGRGELSCFGILLATGAHPRMIGFEGEERFKGHGVAYCATCDGEFFTGKDVFVIGGGFAAAEESVFLTRYAKHVTILIREDWFTCAKTTAEEAANHEKITVLTNVEVEEVGGDSMLRYLRYRNNKTGEVTEYRPDAGETFGVFVFAGYAPATDLVKGAAELTPQGYVVTDEHKQTTIPGLYAAGDVCEKSLRQVVTAVGDGALAATELERYAREMQEKTGLAPEQPGRVEAEAANAGSGNTKSGDALSGNVKSSDAGSNQDSGELFTPDMVAQLKTVFARMQQPLILKLYLDERPVSGELLGYMEELAKQSDKLTVQKASAQEMSELLDVTETTSGEAEMSSGGAKTLLGGAETTFGEAEMSSGGAKMTSSGEGAAYGTPCVRICRQDGTWTGLAFHGVPGGHEFTSFVLGLYNASGPGQPLEPEIRDRINKIDRRVNMKIMVSLSCTMCPELVTAAMRIAAENPNVTAEAFDLNHFPDLKDKYKVMSVPCMVINDQNPTFGKKNIRQLLDLIS